MRKLRRGLLTAYIGLPVLLFAMDIGVLIFILAYWDGLIEINRLGIWVVILIMLSLVVAFQVFRLIQWYRQGKFHR